MQLLAGGACPSLTTGVAYFYRPGDSVFIRLLTETGECYV